MTKGTFVFLFNTGESFRESWDFNTSSPEEAMGRLKRLAPYRMGVLASNVQVIQLVVPGRPTQKVSMRGSGGGFAHPRSTVILYDSTGLGMRATGRKMRGVPRELFHQDQQTPLGNQAMQHFSRVLKDCGGLSVRKDRPPEPFTQLRFFRAALKTGKTVKKPTLHGLKALLGAEEGQRFWDGLKAARPGGA